MRKRYLRWLAWLLSASAAMQAGGITAYADESPPCIEMGVFTNFYSGQENGDGEEGGGNGGEGGKNGGEGKDGRTGLSGNNPGDGTEEIPEGVGTAASGNVITQAPADGDVIGEGKTVLPTKTKWSLSPSFNAVKATSSDTRAVKASLKKDKAKSTKGTKWNYGLIRVKKPGTVTITLEGAEGQKAVYTIYSEDPKMNRAALKTSGYAAISMNSYITGTAYLKPVSVESKRTDVATVSADYSIVVSGNGTSRITVQYPKRKIKGSVKSAMPAFAKESLTLKDRPVKLRIKNLPTGITPIYESSDPEAVKVNSGGFVAPVAQGSAMVTATMGKIRISCTVTVRQR